MVCLVSRSGRELQRYNKFGGRQVVGCIPYRYKEEDNKYGNKSKEDELEVLLVSSQKGGGQALMFPKGGWELDESLQEAASRESIEEAGVIGTLEGELGQWSFISKRHGIYYEGHMFPLFVNQQLDVWPEQHLRSRVWMTVSQAREVCQHWWMKEALDILVKRLRSSHNNNNNNQ